MRWGVGALAWIAPFPLLRYLRLTKGAASRLLFAAAMMLAWTLTVLKIITPPLPLVMSLLGTAYAVVPCVGYLGADALRRRAGERWGTVAFPALMVVLEWLQHRGTGLASWGAGGYTQLDDLPLLQLSSLTGIAGVSFLVYAVGASFESWSSAPSPVARRLALGAALAVVAAHVYGAVRLDHTEVGTTRVAAIGTDATFNGSVTPSDEVRAQTLEYLLADTRSAARAGARLVVWTEAAALVMPAEESAFVERVRRAAVEEHVHVVAAYVVLERMTPLHYENKYAWLTSDGVLDHTYLKHHPALGEPAVVGSGPLTAVDTDFGRAGGAICYDYDYPALAREHGQLDLDLVVLPSSDWRGIDPIHTQMAGVRAIEEGFSLVRSTRFGLTAGIDSRGRIRAQSSSFEASDRVVIMDLPRHGATTPYRRIGDVFVYACFAFLAVAIAHASRARA
jgi:apolipoprotein N-acyltransferase